MSMYVNTTYRQGEVSLQPTPHSAHSLPADSPTSQQSQQDS